MKNSILYSAIRSLAISIFVMLGIGIGFIGIILMYALISKASDKEMSISSDYKPQIVANAEGVRKKLSKTAPVILKLNVTGLIGTDELNMHTVRQQLIESREDVLSKNRVKAVLVHINTPGGTVVDSDGIYRALKQYKKQYGVPVYAYVDGFCASGGMYVASAADKIYSSEISLIGSVGVLLPPFFNVDNLMESIGVKALTITEGKGKDALNPFRPWKKGEEDSYKHLTEYFYNHFVSLVSQSRPNLDKTKLVDEYGAYLYPAQQALEYGFIDKTSISLYETITELAKAIEIEDDFYQVVEMEPKLWIKTFFTGDSPLQTGQVNHRIQFNHIPERMQNQLLYLHYPNQ